MALYFFDILAPEAGRDASGLDLPDEAAARLEAVRRAGVYLKDHPATVLENNELTVRVRGAGGRTVFLVHCLALEPAPAA